MVAFIITILALMAFGIGLFIHIHLDTRLDRIRAKELRAARKAWEAEDARLLANVKPGRPMSFIG
jgi:hypothetical protein